MDVELLAKMIRSLIIDNDKVGLSSVGTFVAEIMPATFSDKGYTINPPYRRLSFLPKVSDDNLLVQLYAKTNNVPEEVAADVIKQFVSELHQVLKDTKMIILPGLGRLRATRENNVFFVADPELDIFSEGYGLEAISLRSHSDNTEATKIDFTFDPKQSEKEENFESEAAVLETPEEMVPSLELEEEELEIVEAESVEVEEELEGVEAVDAAEKVEAEDEIEGVEAEPVEVEEELEGVEAVDAAEEVEAEEELEIVEAESVASEKELESVEVASELVGAEEIVEIEEEIMQEEEIVENMESTEVEELESETAVEETEDEVLAAEESEIEEEEIAGAEIAEEICEEAVETAEEAAISVESAEDAEDEEFIELASEDSDKEDESKLALYIHEKKDDIENDTKVRKFRWWVIVLILLFLAVMAFLTFVTLAQVAPDIIDNFLYTPEELQILNY